MAPTLQHRQAALIAGISSTSTPNFCAAAAPSRWKVSYAVVSVVLVQNIRQASIPPTKPLLAVKDQRLSFPPRCARLLPDGSVGARHGRMAKRKPRCCTNPSRRDFGPLAETRRRVDECFLGDCAGAMEAAASEVT